MLRPLELSLFICLLPLTAEADEPVVADGDRATSIDELDIPWRREDEKRLAIEQEVAWDQIVGYSRQAQEVVIGRVLSSTLQADGAERVVLEVDQALRGHPEGIVEFIVPPTGASDDGEIVRARVVQGYRVLVYLDPARYLVEGNSLFLVEGGYVWRNKRGSVFLKPRADRVWIDEIDPAPNYVVFSLDQVTESLHTTVGKHRRRKRAGG